MKKKTKNNKKDGEYSGTIKVFQEEIKVKGESPSDVIDKLHYKGKFPTKAILTISKGDKSVYRIIPQHLGNRLFNLSPLMREFAVKNLKLLFNGF